MYKYTKKYKIDNIKIEIGFTGHSYIGRYKTFKIERRCKIDVIKRFEKYINKIVELEQKKEAMGIIAKNSFYEGLAEGVENYDKYKDILIPAINILSKYFEGFYDLYCEELFLMGENAISKFIDYLEDNSI